MKKKGNNFEQRKFFFFFKFNAFFAISDVSIYSNVTTFCEAVIFRFR